MIGERQENDDLDQSHHSRIERETLHTIERVDFCISFCMTIIEKKGDKSNIFLFAIRG